MQMQRNRNAACAMGPAPRYMAACWTLSLSILLAGNGVGQSVNTDPLGNSEWTLQQVDEAQAELQTDPESGEMTIRIKSLAKEPLDWKIRLTRQGVAVKEGTSYIVSFRARADGDRQVSLSLNERKPPYAGLGLFRKIDLGPEWRLIRTRFVATATTEDAELFLAMGTHESDVQAADFSLQEAPPPGDPIDAADWNLAVIDVGKADFIIPPDEPDRVSIRLGDISPVKDIWKAALFQKGLQVEGGKDYLLELRARAPSPRSIQISLSQSTAPFENLGLSRTCDLDEGWRLFRFRFRATATEAAAQLRIELANSNTDVEIKGLQFREITENEPTTWELIVFKGCDASLVVDESTPEVTRVVIAKTEDVLMPWHIRAITGGVKVKAGENYTLRLRARSEEPRGIVCAVTHGEPPYRNLGLYQLLTLTTEWQDFQLRFRSELSDDQAQIELSLGNSNIAVELGEVSLEGLDTLASAPDRSRASWTNIIGVASLLIVGAIIIIIRERGKRHAPAEAD